MAEHFMLFGSSNAEYKNVLLPDMRWKVSAKEPSSPVLQVFTAAESFLISGEVLREWSVQYIGLAQRGG